MQWGLDLRERRLNGRFRMAVRREPLHIYLGDGQLVGDVVRVLDGRSLRQSLAERCLLSQHLGQGSVAVFSVTGI